MKTLINFAYYVTDLKMKYVAFFLICRFFMLKSLTVLFNPVVARLFEFLILNFLINLLWSQELNKTSNCCSIFPIFTI